MASLLRRCKPSTNFQASCCYIISTLQILQKSSEDMHVFMSCKIFNIIEKIII